MEQARTGEFQERLRTVVAGHFEVGEPLGSGGFAVVFRARDAMLNRDVAIKVLDPSLALEAGAADRLLDEARIVASIEHANIVPLYEAGHQDGIVFLVMRYYPDGSLSRRLAREGRLEPSAIARLGAQLADALAAAHGRGVLHLDVKPDNILLDEAGHPALVDFGIARLTAARESAHEGLVSGTPHYMSPEQVAGDVLDGRADVYSLGVVLYEMATGQRPIEGDSVKAVMANHIRQVPKAVTTVIPEMPSALGTIITKALAKNPEERFSSAKEMALALEAASAPDQLLAPRIARRRVRRKWYGRGAMVASGILLGLGLLGYAAVKVLSVFFRGEPPAIDAFAPLIPPALVDSARSEGTLTEGDTVSYIFAPHGRGMADALIITRREIVPVTGGHARRYAIDDHYSIDIKRTSNDGFLVISHKERKIADTVYHGMTGREQQAMLFGLRRAFP
jgi:serine/threonine-protein kinase